MKRFLLYLFGQVVSPTLEAITKLSLDVANFKKEMVTKMSEFSDALADFKAEQAALLENVDKEIQQVVALVDKGNTNAADLKAGLEAIQAATQAAKDANTRLAADDSSI